MGVVSRKPPEGYSSPLLSLDLKVQFHKFIALLMPYVSAVQRGKKRSLQATKFKTSPTVGQLVKWPGCP